MCQLWTALVLKALKAGIAILQSLPRQGALYESEVGECPEHFVSPSKCTAVTSTVNSLAYKCLFGVTSISAV